MSGDLRGLQLSNHTEVRVPDIGDFTDVDVIEVLVAPGDEVQRDDALITLETDKAAMDVPSPAGGRVAKLEISVGDKVSQGDLILLLESSREAAEAAREQAGGTGKPAEAAPPPQMEPGAGAAAAAAAASEVRVPDIGEFSGVEIIEVMVAPGRHVAAEDPLITLESDKAAMDVPAPFAGTVTELRVTTGDKVSEGDLILLLQGEAGTAPAAAPATAEPASGAEPAPPAVSTPPASGAAAAEPAPPAGLPPIDEAAFSRAHAGPSVRKLARELGVDLGRVRGTGVKQRITADDVKNFVKQVMSGAAPAGVAPGAAFPQVPQVDFARFGEVEVRPLTRIQKISGPRLHASWVNLPHVTQHDEADITDLEETRQRLKGKAAERGIRLTPLAFIIAGAVQALREFPQVNASLDPAGDSLVLKKYYHIGFAADTPNGLVVPVIRDADKKDIYELAAELAELSGKAREGKLPAADMQGGSFTISSLGGIGGTAFTPIINAPEVAILGVSRSTLQPLWRDEQFVPRLILPLSLSYDHRVIDGALAVRFTTFLAQTLADVTGLLEAVP